MPKQSHHWKQIWLWFYPYLATLALFRKHRGETLPHLVTHSLRLVPTLTTGGASRCICHHVVMNIFCRRIKESRGTSNHGGCEIDLSQTMDDVQVTESESNWEQSLSFKTLISVFKQVVVDSDWIVVSNTEA
ncbi:hypothetical protein ACFE04_014711 [Oxalis oulophora]